jgi:prolyl oligopeptidase
VPAPYPAATRLAKADKLHGRRISDPYRWLEEDEDAACARWLSEQERLYAAHMASLPGRPWFEAQLTGLQEMGGALVPVATPPVWRGARSFFLRRNGGAELPVLITVDDATGEKGRERVLVDPLALDPTGLTHLTAWRPSWSRQAAGLPAYRPRR